MGALSVPLLVWRPTAYVKDVDATFASALPGEELRIEYGVTDLSQVYRSGLIRIFGTNSGDDPIFQQRLEATDIGPTFTTREFRWSGFTGGTQPDGSVYEVPAGPFEHDPDQARFANVLFSPYLVQVLFWPTEEPGGRGRSPGQPGAGCRRSRSRTGCQRGRNRDCRGGAAPQRLLRRRNHHHRRCPDDFSWPCTARVSPAARSTAT